MKKAFSLIELMIVVAILGILAAIVIPEFQSNTKQAKEAAAKDTLRVLRNQIELYAARNNGIPPGYPLNNTAATPSYGAFVLEMRDKYLQAMPKNPFNGFITILVLGDAEPIPAAATGDNGWIYKPATKTLKLDWTGTDSEGVSYFNY